MENICHWEDVGQLLKKRVNKEYIATFIPALDICRQADNFQQCDE